MEKTHNPAAQDFGDLMKDALEHINNAGYLSSHPLAGELAALDPGNGLPGDVRLRNFMLDLIERLKPEETLPEWAPEWRWYVILHNRYVLRQRMWAIETRLSISERQARRDHVLALEAFVALGQSQLDAMRQAQATSVPAVPVPSTLQEAVQRLSPARTRVALSECLEEVARLQAQVRQHGGDAVTWTATPPGLMVVTDRGILVQALMKLCQAFIDPAVPAGPIRLRASGSAGSVAITLSVPPGAWPGRDQAALEVVALLADVLPARFEVDPPEARLSLTITHGPEHSSQRPSLRILVIDDEALSIDMFHDYLAGLDVEVHGETRPDEALSRALELQPDLILLDVMMPGLAGWELLQQIRHNVQLRDVPVVVHSVLEDVDTALALGAARFYRKPILRQQLLNLLAEVLGYRGNR